VAPGYLRLQDSRLIDKGHPRRAVKIWKLAIECFFLRVRWTGVVRQSALLADPAEGD
jgi:hypothetical protein